MSAYFSKRTLDFLFDLDVNNTKPWFEANRERFVADAQEPMLRFITDAADPIHRRISTHLVADPRRNGGSMFRIHRDMRFSPDRIPYKTNIGAQFRHAAGKDAHAPGLYLQIEPGNCMMAVGMWRPDNATLGKVRERIDAKPAAWTRVVNGLQGWEWFEDTLVRPPKGYDADHRHIVDLKRKSFAVSRPLTERQVTSRTFLDTFIDNCVEAKPLMRFLCAATGQPF